MNLFVSGRDVSLRTAGEIEVALDDLFGEQEPYASLGLALASYRPEGGEYLYDRDQVVAMMRPVLQVLLQRSPDTSEDDQDA